MSTHSLPSGHRSGDVLGLCRPRGLSPAALVAGLLLAACAQTALAQSFPSRPVRMMVPYPPGGAVDIVARLMSERMSRELGVPVAIENKAGAAGVIGAEQVARSPADGYSVVMSTVSSHAIAPAVYRKMPYDPVADFAPITVTVLTPYIITVNPQVPANTLAELIALARARPGTLAFGSSGTGTTPHLAGELFNTLAGVKLTHVPYKGSAPMVNDLLGGQVQVAFDNTVIPHIRSGRLRGLAVTGSARLAAVPDIPTPTEAGLSGYEAVGWMGLMAPRATPAPVIARLQQAAAAALGQAEVKERLEAMGFQGAADTPEQFARFLASEIGKWARVVKDAGIQPE